MITTDKLLTINLTNVNKKVTSMLTNCERKCMFRSSNKSNTIRQSL